MNNLLPSHPSQINNIISANSSAHGDDDQSNISILVAPQDDEKPRHRHSPTQLAALNELYEKNEHPNLDDRNELAEKLGMETKAVYVWFQNRREKHK
ncbi:homeobox-domain-containing protein [Rhizopogon vinicolor AM-OR11-026]|uniref:Homeobox-domain-containing protein n=1 Tax=Rhizopogon vinicolor AM-OR11-026 TaxID=1314800 RepID=A0A1B7MQB7_9AGAM|nr:homeobox-domain-containing protein [Rhizopogon vinicolor AM-OR11-026]